MFAWATRIVPIALVILSLLLPIAAWSQAQSTLPGQPNALPPVPNGIAVPLISRNQSQDAQFLALLRARDQSFANVTEWRRIISYNDNLQAELESLFTEVGAFKPFTP